MIMKYIIAENRLHDLMTSYLDSLLEYKIVSRVDNFIVISDNVESDDNQWRDIMEFDRGDGRMWVNREFLKEFNDIFGRGYIESLNFITEWFENKYNVKSKYQSALPEH